MHATKLTVMLAGWGGALAMGLAAQDAEAGHYSIGPVHAPTYVSSPYVYQLPVVVQPVPLVYTPPVIIEHTPIYRDYPVYTRPHPIRPRYVGYHGRYGHYRHRGHYGHRGHRRGGFGFSFGFGYSR